MSHKKELTITLIDRRFRVTHVETLTVNLSEPFASIVPVRMRRRFDLGTSHINATLRGERQRAFTAAAQLIFMDATGLRIPTKVEQRKALGFDCRACCSGFDHRNAWIDRETRHVFTTNEPYWYAHIDSIKWAAENGCRLEMPQWPGMWNPPRSPEEVESSTVFQIIGPHDYPHWGRLLERINSIDFTPPIAIQQMEESAVTF